MKIFGTGKYLCVRLQIKDKFVKTKEGKLDIQKYIHSARIQGDGETKHDKRCQFRMKRTGEDPWVQIEMFKSLNFRKTCTRKKILAK